MRVAERVVRRVKEDTSAMLLRSDVRCPIRNGHRVVFRGQETELRTAGSRCAVDAYSWFVVFASVGQQQQRVPAGRQRCGLPCVLASLDSPSEP